VSTIKVDTYLTRGGASEIAIDKLKGASSASSISVVAEGGTNTTNLQQGLCKAWAFKQSSGGGITDSLNMSSIDDDGTGDYGLNYTNAFNNVAYIPNQNVRGGVAAGNSDGHFAEVQTCNTTSAECQTWYGDAGTNATFIDWEVRHTFFGDLA